MFCASRREAAARKLALTLTLRTRFNFSEHDHPAWSAAQAPLRATSEAGSGDVRYLSRRPAGRILPRVLVAAACRGAGRACRFRMRAELRPRPGPDRLFHADRNAYLSA